MEPLERWDGSGFPEDFKLFEDNQELYEELSVRGDKLINDALTAYLGPGMKLEPLPTLDELNASLGRYLSNAKKITNGELHEHFASTAHEIALKISNKEYCITAEQKSYKRAYDKKAKSFYQSKLFTELHEEIYQYNVKKATEFWGRS